MFPIIKVFDESGDLKIQFAAGDIDGIKEWLRQTHTPLEHAVKSATEVDSPVFGKALEFPCTISD
jgi:hypothetical protein